MTTAKPAGVGPVVGWVLLTLLTGGAGATGLALQVWQPGDLLTPHDRLPYVALMGVLTVLLGALQAQWLLGRERWRAHEEQRVRLEDTVRQRTLVLEKAEHDLRTVLDAVPVMIGYWDCDLHNRVANRAHHEWFGVEPGQMPGRSVHDLLGPDLYERSRSHIEAALRGEPQSFERSVMRPDGQGERRSLAQYCLRRSKSEPPGVRPKTWTG